MASRNTGANRLTAFLAGDARYDGRFVAGVVTTGIYCRPGCTCRKPKPENVRLFETPTEAETAGFRACKRCRPELAGGSEEAERHFRDAVLRAMEERLGERLTLSALASALATSPTHLARRFRRVDGRSPMRALADLRADRARQLLGRPGARVTEVAFQVGFGSPTAFVRAFRRRTGRLPSQWNPEHPS
jgi:methylphosphotriester-DNA--protein-cysteine methyltransferase